MFKPFETIETWSRPTLTVLFGPAPRWLRIILWSFIGGLFVFLTILSPHTAEDAKNDERARVRTEALASVYRHFLLNGVDSARIEANGGTLDVYAKKTEFESISFPDREAFIESAGKLWCPSQSDAFLPALRIYDIRSGEKLGAYSCTLQWVSMP